MVYIVRVCLSKNKSDWAENQSDCNVKVSDAMEFNYFIPVYLLNDWYYFRFIGIIHATKKNYVKEFVYVEITRFICWFINTYKL